MKSSIVKNVLAVLCFACVLIASQWLLKGTRVDMTEQNIYSLSQGSKNILGGLQQDVSITLFFSDKASKDLTALRSYALRVQELLQEYTLLSDGKLTFTVIDPEPFSEEEDKAAEIGLQAVPLGTGDDVYFGLSAKNIAGEEANIAFLQPDKEAFLEYQISELIYRLGQTTTPVVGLMSDLEMQGGFDMRSGGTTPPWTIYEQLDQLYTVRLVDAQTSEIDKDIQLLILVQPSNLSDSTLYEIDQFVMSGGKLLVFMDPKAETQQGPASQEEDESEEGGHSLTKLFEQWGIEYKSNQIVTDSVYGLTVSMGENQPPMRHPGLLGIQQNGLNPNEVVTSDLESLNFASSGVLNEKSRAGVQSPEGSQFDALVWSSDVAQVVDADTYNATTDPSQLLNGFVASGESYVLAARLSGIATSAFDAKPLDSERESQHVKITQSLNVIVVADTDVLTDRLWVQVQTFFGQRIAQPWADNGAFVNNLVEQYLGSSDLIGIRSRGRFSRPFEVVQDIQQKAQDEYLANEEVLQQQLQDTEEQLALLEQQRAQESLTLSPAQEVALENFQHQKLRIRKALRDVRHELDKDIESLGNWLKVLNIAVFPLLLTCLLLLLTRLRLRR